MLMNDLIKMRIFELLSEISQEVTNDELQNAYSELLEHIRCVSGGTDYALIYRTLNATRIELAFLKIPSLYGQREKCPKEATCSKTIGICRC